MLLLCYYVLMQIFIELFIENDLFPKISISTLSYKYRLIKINKTDIIFINTRYMYFPFRVRFNY